MGYKWVGGNTLYHISLIRPCALIRPVFPLHNTVDYSTCCCVLKQNGVSPQSNHTRCLSSSVAGQLHGLYTVQEREAITVMTYLLMWKKVSKRTGSLSAPIRAKLMRKSGRRLICHWQCLARQATHCNWCNPYKQDLQQLKITWSFIHMHAMNDQSQ